MSDDCFDWEKKLYQPQIEIVTAIMVNAPDDQIGIQTGFQRIEEGFILPTTTVTEKKRISESAVELVCCHTHINKKWVNLQFVGFFDNIHSEEEPRTIRFLYRTRLPQTITRKDKLEWLTHGQLARSSNKLVGDYQRLFTAAFNC
jgi:hypothetical protein